MLRSALNSTFLAELKKAVQHSILLPLGNKASTSPPNLTKANRVDSRFLRRDRRVLPAPRNCRAVRHRLCRNLFRRPAAAVDPPGAEVSDIAVEFSSLSKTYSMASAGASACRRRLQRLIAALSRVKTGLDYGAFDLDPGGGHGGAFFGPSCRSASVKPARAIRPAVVT